MFRSQGELVADENLLPEESVLTLEQFPNTTLMTFGTLSIATDVNLIWTIHHGCIYCDITLEEVV